jgi:ABC-type multidrug transport system fused ATPase/permease subunit
MTKAERVIRYTKLEPEADLENEATKPIVPWPSEGRIVFDHVSFAYSDDTKVVLKNIFCDIQAREKVLIFHCP